jgi:DNA invertase Pin-like site-specific DNA recombinase
MISYPQTTFQNILLKDMLHILERLTEVGAGFRTLTENVDSTVPAGKMLLSMLGAFAEFERSMVRERTRMGLQAARERGRIGAANRRLNQTSVPKFPAW